MYIVITYVRMTSFELQQRAIAFSSTLTGIPSAPGIPGRPVTPVSPYQAVQ